VSELAPFWRSELASVKPSYPSTTYIGRQQDDLPVQRLSPVRLNTTKLVHDIDRPIMRWFTDLKAVIHLIKKPIYIKLVYDPDQPIRK